MVSPEDAAKNIAAIIDHTALKPEATPADIEKLCQEAKTYGFAAVCVNPTYVKMCSELLAESSIAVASVVGFPLGASTIQMKSAETSEAVENGANEIDMVIPVGRLKSGDYDHVRRDIQAVVSAASGKLVKVIIEAALLTDDEKVIACQIAQQAGAHFVKTSTGFSKSGATPDDVALMRKVVGDSMGVKAAGGIRTFADAMVMVHAGANRIGASSGVQIVRESQVI
ncbi:MAG: deoxyribose-phosphate aldolase [Candidatus Marinimicrobia bacterium CG08_land_8_20_14_0_20_45_22]|nr:MAG: deoxyribose-phosphate aldolase [Candidatus Marinimicrobia bacterium CG08_land_8_20_14_0_20_45_22]